MKDPDIGDLVQTSKPIYTSVQLVEVKHIPEGTIGIILHHTQTFAGKRYETYFSVFDQPIFLDEHEFKLLKKA